MSWRTLWDNTSWGNSSGLQPVAWWDDPPSAVPCSLDPCKPQALEVILPLQLGTMLVGIPVHQCNYPYIYSI